MTSRPAPSADKDAAADRESETPLAPMLRIGTQAARILRDLDNLVIEDCFDGGIIQKNWP